MTYCEIVAMAWVANLLAFAAGAGLSWIVDVFPGYGKLHPKLKRLCFLAACVLIAAVAYGAGYVGDCPLPPWQDIVVAIALAFTGGQIAHLRKL